MKKLIAIVIILFGIFTIGVNAQTETSVFGWTTLDPPFPTTDTAILEESQEVFTQIPLIPGYENLHSLKVSITNNGTSYLFLTSTFPSTRVFPSSGVQFIVKEMIGQGQYLDIKPIFFYNNEWYKPGIQSKTNLQDNWKKIDVNGWESINTYQPYPLDSIYIDTCYLWLLYNSDGEYYFDTWYYYSNFPEASLICGYGDVISSIEIPGSPPNEYALLQNYPNPFNPSTKIEFSVPISSEIEITIYDLFGRKIKTLEKNFYQQGQYQTIWDGTNEANTKVASGTYIYILYTNSSKLSKKMILIK
jgi:hypothetical protein